MLNANICVVLPSPVAYSETFLQAHVERLSAAVSYLQDFPIDIDYAFPKQLSPDTGEWLKRTLRVSWHRSVLNPIKSMSLRKFFRTHNINIVLAEYGLTGIGILGLCKELGIPLVVHFHGSDAYKSEWIERYQTSYKKMFAYSGALISVSRHMTEQLIGLGAAREKVFYNPYGIDVGKFKPACPLRSPLQVIAVGRFVDKKAPYLTILAFQKLLERLPTAKLVMIGDGPLRDVCHKIITSLHIEHAVELKGVVNQEDVARLMQQSRVFVQHSLVPSSGDSEGAPNSILEAGASGLPAVSTRHAGIPEIVIHGQTGFLVDEGDIDSMAEYIYQLLTNSELASEMGKKARAHISANFNMDRSIEKLWNILEKCCQ